MKKGRRPVPTKLKLLRDNPGKRPVNRREPMPEGGLPACPEWLEPDARAEWLRLAPELGRLELATALDSGALAGYCQAWSRWRAAEEFLSRHGTVVVLRNDKGEVKLMTPAPQVGIAHKYLEKMRQFAAELGLSPAARASLVVGRPGAEDEDPFARLMAG